MSRSAKALSLFTAVMFVASAVVSGQATSVTGFVSIPYLTLAVQLANRLHSYMLDSTAGAYYSALSSNWVRVQAAQFTTLGNAFIDEGLVQLYKATGNQTYLSWASSASERFWQNAWDTTKGGFYDVYGTNWKNVDCNQYLQDNAMFLVVFLNLYGTNGSATWLHRANEVETLLNNRFWSTTDNIAEVSYDVCDGQPSGDVNIEQSIGSYVWATAQWSAVTGNTSYMDRMSTAVSFARAYLWDSSNNTLPGGAGSVDCTANGFLGFMRSAYANLSGLQDCRKGANEDIWGAVGLAYFSQLTDNATVRSWVNQDLTWINRTLWDPTLGGYHNDAFRDDTLRSSCASTSDPRDYPGWTEGEQPMFWWQIGGILGNTTQTRWALVAEKWTATHQWNYTHANGGDMTCLDSNALPDAGSTELYDWIQGSALYSFSTLSSTPASSSGTSTVISTITTTMTTTISGTVTTVTSKSLTTLTYTYYIMPASSVPEFPFGLLAVILLAIAAILVLRSRYPLSSSREKG